mgnify:CR=1 FL=1
MDEIQQTNGPIFEAGPGWGSRVNNWLRKHGLILILIILAIAIPLLSMRYFKNKKFENPLKDNSQIVESFKEIIQRGDSATLITRRAISSYIASRSDLELSAGQRIYMEEILRKSKQFGKLIVGATIEFTRDEIQAAVEKAKQLTPYQLKVWESYANKIKF